MAIEITAGAEHMATAAQQMPGGDELGAVGALAPNLEPAIDLAGDHIGGRSRRSRGGEDMAEAQAIAGRELAQRSGDKRPAQAAALQDQHGVRIC